LPVLFDTFTGAPIGFLQEGGLPILNDDEENE
jgi:hypothetical protein